MLEAPSKIPNAQQNVSKYTQKYYKINFFARTNTKVRKKRIEVKTICASVYSRLDTDHLIEEFIKKT